MDDNLEVKTDDSEEKGLEYFKTEIAGTSKTTYRKAIEKFVMAALGVIPWVGGFIAAAASMKTEKADAKREDLQNQWLEEHSKKIINLKLTINQITDGFNNIGDTIDDRIQSEEYLDIVRKAFRAWDNADTEEKRKYVANLIGNAAGTNLCSDDLLRLFVDWLNSYHEAHFAVIREIYSNPGVTRYDIWESLHGEIVREDSAEADLFKKLIRDLSTGGVIRQARETTEDGRFIKKRQPSTRRKTTTMESAFEDTKQYMLTELGKQFVHYTMNEIVPRVDSATESQHNR